MSVRDFQTEKLESKDLEAFVVLTEELRREMVTASFPKIVPAVSAEATMATTDGTLAASRAKHARRDLLVLKGAANMTASEKDELKGMSSSTVLMKEMQIALALSAAATAAKKESDAAAGRVETYIKARLGSELLTVYNQGAEDSALENNRYAQVHAGIKAVEKRMQVAVKEYEHHYLAKLTSFMFSRLCNSSAEVEELIIKVNGLEEQAKRHHTQFGGTNRVTDESMVNVICTCTLKDKSNDIDGKVHEAISDARNSTTPVNWLTFSNKILNIVKIDAIATGLRQSLMPAGTSVQHAFAAQAVPASHQGQLDPITAARINSLEAQLAQAQIQSSNHSNGMMAFNANGVGGGYQGFNAAPLGMMGFGGGGFPMHPGQFSMYNQAFAAAGGGGGAAPWGQRDKRCYEFLNSGKCNRGDSCRFDHVSGGAGAGSGQVPVPDPRNKIPCFNGSKCKGIGSGCAFNHSTGGKSRAGSPAKQVGDKRKKA